MLSRTTSLELAEWRAYEIKAGPLGEQWQHEVLAAIHEQLQFANHLMGAAFLAEDGENPIPSVKHFPRPGELFSEIGSPETEDDEED